MPACPSNVPLPLSIAQSSANQRATSASSSPVRKSAT